MKKIIAFLTVTIIGISCFSQQADNLQSIKKMDYLQKSKNQKTAAWVLVGGGIAMTVTGMVIYQNAYNKAAEDDPFGTLVSLAANVNPTGAVIATLGLLASTSSIPFFIASGKNKKKSRAISTGFKMENASVIQRAVLLKHHFRRFL